MRMSGLAGGVRKREVWIWRIRMEEKRLVETRSEQLIRDSLVSMLGIL